MHLSHRAAAAAALFVLTAALANVLTDRLPMVPVWPGLTVTAGTFAAGAALALRDVVHDAVPRRRARYLLLAGLIAAGTGLSWALAGPGLALASGAAFAVSEGCDLAVYAPLRARGRRLALAVSNVVGAVVDTLVFLAIAPGPYLAVTAAAVAGQLLGKAYATAPFLLRR